MRKHNYTFTKIKILWPIALLGLVVSSCEVGPKYHAPKVAVADTWKSKQIETEAIPQVDHWWEVFNDPKLNELIELAIRNSPTLSAASHRVEQAREFSKIHRGRLFPQVNFDPAASTSPRSVHTFGTTPTPPPSLIKNNISKYVLPFSLLYEFDFWGKWRGEYKAAKLKAEAQAEAYQTSLLLLTTDLATTYFQIRIHEAQVRLLKQTVEKKETALNIQDARYSAHLINYKDVAHYKVALSSIESKYYDVVKRRSLLENQIAILIGKSPSEFTLEVSPLKELPPKLPATVPATVLLRRPDLKEQEKIMASLHKEINIAYASYFPSVDLAGGFAFIANDFIRTARNAFSIGGNFVQYLLDWGQRTANVKVAKERFGEALDIYREKILTAFKEVEDSLTSLEWLEKQLQSTKEGMEASKIAYRISLDRYHVGLSSYLTAADDACDALTYEYIYLDLLSQNYLYTVHLIKAIGGGWKS